MSAHTTFEAWAAQYKPYINGQLQSVFATEQKIARSTAHNAAYIDLLNELAILVGRGGKRLRPLLCLLAYEAYGGQDRAVATQLAVAQELLHTFLLVHDDIIDRDSMRWGGLNISGVYFERFSTDLPAPDALHMAQSWALLAGDVCLTLANRVIQNSGVSPDIGVIVQQLTGQAVLEVISGELSDCAGSLPASRPSVSATLAMYNHKTASYSFRLPLQTGASAAGVGFAEQHCLPQLAEHLGIAYQLHDDILGMFGDPEQIGKPNFSDLREGKRTLLTLTALKRTTPKARKNLLALLGQSNAGPAELAAAQEIIRECGALEYTQNMANNHLQQASALIKTTTMNTTGQARLQDLLEQLVTRDS